MRNNQFNILLQAIAAISDKLDKFESKTEKKLAEHDKRFDSMDLILKEHTGILKKHTDIPKEHTSQLDEHTGLLVSIPQATSDLISDPEGRHGKRIIRIEKHLKLQPAT